MSPERLILLRRAGTILATLASCTAARPVATHPVMTGPAPPLASSERPGTGANGVLDRYCLRCHDEVKRNGGVALPSLLASLREGKHTEQWQAVLDQITTLSMPPDDEDQPTPEERDLLVQFIEAGALKLDCSSPPPGRTTAQRLNRREYERSVQQLLGVSVPLAHLLPIDNAGLGFDNIADALTTSPLLVEHYLDAADVALDAAMPEPASLVRRRRLVPVDLAEIGAGARPRGDGWMILTSDQQDEVSVRVSTPVRARYRLSVFAERWRSPPKPAAPVDPRKSQSLTVDRPVFTVSVDDEARTLVDLERSRPSWYEATVEVPVGEHRISIGAKRSDAAIARASRGMVVPPSVVPPSFRMEFAVKTIAIDGPIDADRGPSPAHKRLFFTMPRKRADWQDVGMQLVTRFARQAYRRPLASGELAPLSSLMAAAWKKGETFERGVRRAFTGVLLSPQFLFRFDESTQQDGALDEHALASRLSYFLWSAPPDQAIGAKADAGVLRTQLEAEIDRMIHDPKIAGFVTNFGGQWLGYRNLDDAAPAFYIFKSFDEPLRAAMREETSLLLRHVLRTNATIFDFLLADYTFVDERLAAHYGIHGVAGHDFRQVSLSSTPRRGVLTHGSILTITSSTTRTSPVKRGKWVLETLLDAPPPPPPPDVPEIADGNKLTASMRETLEEHRKNPACATCHARMDPIGFGLEHFDGIGAYRTTDHGAPIDASGMFAGHRFASASELVSLLVKSKGQVFVKAFTGRLMTYALGRPLLPAERCAVQEIMAQTQPDGHRFADLVKAVVKHRVFGHTHTGTMARSTQSPPIERR